jgi:molybdopterin molybdotransferase
MKPTAAYRTNALGRGRSPCWPNCWKSISSVERLTNHILDSGLKTAASNFPSPTVLPGAGDDLDELKARISAAAGSCEILITTGGVSVGKYDLTKAAFAELGAEIFFDRVSLKPGKPTVFARRRKTLIFGLPGNPVSAAVTFYLFVRRALMIMQSTNETELPSGFAVLASDVKGTRERESFLPARLGTDSQGRLLALPLRWHGSSDLIGFAQAEALIRIPQDRSIEEGQTAEILFLP